MDGAQEVERNGAAQAVSAKVDTGVRPRVSFGEPDENTGVGGWRGWFQVARWTNGRGDRFGERERQGGFVMARSILAARRGRIGSQRSGQTVVELALLLPLLLLLMVGVIEIGRYAYFDILVSNAARAGAQYGAQSLIQAADVNGITTAAQNDGLNTMAITAIQQCGCAAGALGACPSGAVCPQPLTYVKVTATDTYNSLFNYPGIPRQLTLSSTVTMRVSP